jgi:hypothetical protein
MVAYTSSAEEVVPPALSAPAKRRSLAAEATQDRPETATAEPSLWAVILRWLIWGPAAVIVVSACAIVGGLAFFMLPLAGVLYAFVALIAWLGPGDS